MTAITWLGKIKRPGQGLANCFHAPSHPCPDDHLFSPRTSMFGVIMLVCFAVRQGVHPAASHNAGRRGHASSERSGSRTHRVTGRAAEIQAMQFGQPQLTTRFKTITETNQNFRYTQSPSYCPLATWHLDATSFNSALRGYGAATAQLFYPSLGQSL